MKKFLLIVLMLGFAYQAQAYQEVLFKINASSVISGAGTTLLLPNTGPGDVLVSVVIGNCGAPGSTFTIYDSSATALQQVTPTMSASTSSVANGSGDCRNQFIYNVTLSSGLTYSVVGVPPPSVAIYYWRRTKNYLGFGF